MYLFVLAPVTEALAPPEALTLMASLPWCPVQLFILFSTQISIVASQILVLNTVLFLFQALF